jgi:endoglucanase
MIRRYCMVLLLVWCAPMVHSAPVPQGQPAILTNQVGYRVDWPKHALIRNISTTTNTMTVIDLNQQQVLAQLPLSTVQTDIHSADRIRTVQFDHLPIGRYQLRIDGVTSTPFEVSASPEVPLQRLLLRSFYLQRCGIHLQDATSQLEHEQDHQHDGRIYRVDPLFPQITQIDARGGWHDAGDYGKYVVTTTIAVAHLLDSYELSPKQHPDGALDIPESGNGRADILDEAQVGLDWLLRMQRPDGAIWRKVAGHSWPKSLRPDQDQQTRYVFGISSPETAKFVAVMAQAARVYQLLDPARATQYQQAALRSWDWLKRQPSDQHQQIDWQIDDDRGSGRYLYSNTDRELSLLTDQDDRLWAAAELWLLTKEAQYLNIIEQAADLTASVRLFEWKNPTALAVIHLLRSPDLPTALHTQFRRSILQAAESAYWRTQQSAYRLANHRLVWGSNKMTVAEGYLLATAYGLSHDAKYWHAAQQQLDFVLGLNPQAISFVTGIGTHRVRHVAHLYARAVKRDIAGLLVGGANIFAQDQIAPKQQGLYSYVDDGGAYSVNEYAIDYNAALIGLISILNAHTPPQQNH